MVEASRESFFEREVIEGYWEEFSHAWMSSEGKAEAFNMSHRKRDSTRGITRFLIMNPSVGKHFDKVANEGDDGGDGDEDGEDQDRASSRMFEMKRKGLSAAVRNWCIVQELGERHLLDEVDHGELFGPKVEGDSMISFKESADNFMEKVDDWRAEELYPHSCTSSDCKRRGCEKVTVVDGCWKLSYPICMWDNGKSIPADIRDFIPHDCVHEPAPGKAFCKQHAELLEARMIPTGLREFIAYAGASSENYNQQGRSKVRETLAKLSEAASIEGTTSVESQRIEGFLTNGMATKDMLQEIPESNNAEECRKDTGDPVRLRRRIRGILAFISGKTQGLVLIGEQGGWRFTAQCFIPHFQVVASSESGKSSSGAREPPRRASFS